MERFGRARSFQAVSVLRGDDCPPEERTRTAGAGGRLFIAFRTRFATSVEAVPVNHVVGRPWSPCAPMINERCASRADVWCRKYGRFLSPLDRARNLHCTLARLRSLRIIQGKARLAQAWRRFCSWSSFALRTGTRCHCGQKVIFDLHRKMVSLQPV